VSTSYSNLQNKIKKVFPCLQSNETFTATWKDSDGDQICISTDEELQIALTELQGPVFKIYITAADDNLVNEEKSKCGQQHPGVICDGCSGPVIGFRYKCMECPDYDLCSQCENKAVHPGHNMMRMASAQGTWPHFFFKRLQKLQERAAAKKQNSRDLEGEQVNADDGKKKDVGKKRNANKKEKKNEEKRDESKASTGSGVNASANGAFMNMASLFHGFPIPKCPSNLPESEASNSSNSNAFLNAFMGNGSIHDFAHKEALKAAKAAFQQPTSENGASGYCSDDFLKNIGSHVGAALDPFGINVDIDIETPSGRSRVFTTSNSSPTSTSSTGAEEPDDKQTKTNQDEKLHGGQEKTVDESRSSSTSCEDLDDWTVCGKSCGETPKEAAETTVTDEDGKNKPKNLDGEAIVRPMHPNPRVQVALQAMLNMGFTNEGGWLANLIDAKDGDIGKVLDIIQPTRN